MRRIFLALALATTTAVAPGLSSADDAKPQTAQSAAPSVTQMARTEPIPQPGETSADGFSTGGMTIADLDKLLAPLVGDGDVASRRNAAKAVLDLGPDAIGAIAKELDVLRNNQDAAVAAGIKMAREGHRSDPDFDLMEGLIVAKKTDGPGVKTALTTVVLLRALARMGTTPAVKVMLQASDDHAGAFRAEIARLFHDLGDRALPALIVARKDQSADVRRFAHAQIDALGKKTAGDAVQTKSNQVLADVLRAYAEVHEIDAVPVILSFVSSDRAEVQTAAREAIIRFGQDAVWKVREAYTNLTGKSPPDNVPAREVAKELFAAYDRVKLREVYEALDNGKKLEQAGKLDEAVAAYDSVLARQPLLDRRVETVPGYVAYAKSQEDGKPDVARATFKKALRIDPEGPHAAQIRGELFYLEGRDLEAHGIADPELFRRALTADPANERARAELDRLDAGSEGRRAKLQRWAIGGVLGAIAVGVLVLFGGRRRKLAASAT
jgi:tetratricopeptide (TPR) repeat protein